LGISTVVSQRSETSKFFSVIVDHLTQMFRGIGFKSNPYENSAIILTLRPTIESFKQKLEVNKQLFSSTQLEGIQVVIKNLEDNFKVHDDFKQEKLVRGQYIQETEDNKSMFLKFSSLLASNNFIFVNSEPNIFMTQFPGYIVL
jgi:hypothetical protein